MASMEGRVCLVTGATGGIGRVTAEALAREGARVILLGRDRERADRAVSEIRQATGNDAVEAILADLSSMAQVRAAAAEVRSRHDRLHVLVNNAGALNMAREVTEDGFERTFAVNHLAYFLLTHELLDLLKASAPARIVNVASHAHRRGRVDFDDPNYERRRYSGWGAYSDSKLMNLLFTFELARRLEGTGVTVNATHPGVVASGFSSNNPLFGLFWRLAGPFMRTSEQGAEGMIRAAIAPELEGVTGRYFLDDRERTPTAAARDEEAARRLWQTSERLLGIG